MKWARRGLVGTVINGEPVPLIQNRVEDAGFKDLDIIPLGADKVFIHSLSGVNVSDIVTEAQQFFDLLFSHMVCWDKAVLPFQRGHDFVCLGFRYMHGIKVSLSYVFLIADSIYNRIIALWVEKNLILLGC